MAIVDGHIRCRKCDESKPVSAFRPSVVAHGSGYCRECFNEYLRTYRERHPEKFRAYYESRDPEKTRQYQLAQARKFRALPRGEQQEIRRRKHLRYRYDITATAYDALLAVQGGLCACCGGDGPKRARSRNMHVDHDHTTGALRGLICNPCNLGIGALGDTLEGVRRALNYLERSEQHPPTRSAPKMRINLLSGTN